MQKMFIPSSDLLVDDGTFKGMLSKFQKTTIYGTEAELDLMILFSLSFKLPFALHHVPVKVGEMLPCGVRFIRDEEYDKILVLDSDENLQTIAFNWIDQTWEHRTKPVG